MSTTKSTTDEKKDDNQNSIETKVQLCDIVALYNQIQSKWSNKLIDIRNKIDYDAAHITHSLNIGYPIF